MRQLVNATKRKTKKIVILIIELNCRALSREPGFFKKKEGQSSRKDEVLDLREHRRWKDLWAGKDHWAKRYNNWIATILPVQHAGRLRLGDGHDTAGPLSGRSIF